MPAFSRSTSPRHAHHGPQRSLIAARPAPSMQWLALLITAALLALFATPAAAQDVMNKESATEMRKHFLLDLDTLQAKFTALAKAFPDDKFSWRPGPGVRSVGETFMHVASEYYVFTPMAYGQKRSTVIPPGQAAFAEFEKNSTRADVNKHLAEGFAFMKKSIVDADINTLTGVRKIFGGDHTIAETSLVMSADLHEHLGQLIAYARMNGVKPPWSK